MVGCGHSDWPDLETIDIFNYLGLNPWEDYTKAQVVTASRRFFLRFHPDKLKKEDIPAHANLDQIYIGPITEVIRSFDTTWQGIASRGRSGWRSTWNPSLPPSDAGFWQPIPAYIERASRQQRPGGAAGTARPGASSNANTNRTPPNQTRSTGTGARSGPGTGTGATQDDPINVDNEDDPFIISSDEEEEDDDVEFTGQRRRRPGSPTPRQRNRPRQQGASDTRRRRPRGRRTHTNQAVGREGIANLRTLAGAPGINAVAIAVVRGQVRGIDTIIPTYLVVASLDSQNRLNFRVINRDLSGEPLSAFGNGRASSIRFEAITQPPLSGRLVGRFVNCTRDQVRAFLLGYARPGRQ